MMLVVYKSVWQQSNDLQEYWKTQKYDGNTDKNNTCYYNILNFAQKDRQPICMCCWQKKWVITLLWLHSSAGSCEVLEHLKLAAWACWRLNLKSLKNPRKLWHICLKWPRDEDLNLRLRFESHLSLTFTQTWPWTLDPRIDFKFLPKLIVLEMKKEKTDNYCVLKMSSKPVQWTFMTLKFHFSR